MWGNKCVFFLLVLGQFIDNGLGSFVYHDDQSGSKQDILTELKRELRNELVPDIRKEIRDEILDDFRNEVRSQMKETIKDELRTMVQELVKEQREDECARQCVEKDEESVSEEDTASLVKEAVQTELATGIRDIVVDEIKQTLPDVLASLSINNNASQSLDSEHPVDKQSGILDTKQMITQKGRLSPKKRSVAADISLSDTPRAAGLHQVAFCVYLDHIMDHIPHLTTIKFNYIQLNDGNAYNIHTGVFTAPVSGVYMFHFEFLGWTRSTELRLVVDNVVAATAIAEHQGADSYLLKAGTTTLVRVANGQSVWVETFARDDGNVISTATDKSTSFLGVHLY